MNRDDTSEESPERRPASRGASTALFLGMIAVVSAAVIVGGLVGIGAIVLGNRALRAINRSEGRLPGRAMARGGVILGGVAIVLSVFAAGFWLFAPANHNARDRQRVVLTINHMRQIGMACHLYANDYDGALPPHLAAGMTGYGILPETLLDARSGVMPMSVPAGAVEGRVDWHVFSAEVDGHCDFVYLAGGLREKDFPSAQAAILYAKLPAEKRWLVALADGSVEEMSRAEFDRALAATNDARVQRGLPPAAVPSGK